MGSRLEIAKYTTIRNTLIKKVQGYLGICPNMDGASFQLPKLLIKIAHKSPKKTNNISQNQAIFLNKGFLKGVGGEQFPNNPEGEPKRKRWELLDCCSHAMARC
jgi:hypothetical protein